MKYQRAAIILATTAVLSICPLGSDALDTTQHGGVNKPSPMYGYCIGCVALMAHTSDNTEPSAKTVSSSIEMVKTKTSSRLSVGLDHSTSSATKLFLPSSTNTPPSGEHPTPPNATGHRLQSLVNLHHQLNLIMSSRSMHNKQELFLQDLLALSLFLVALAIGFAWSNNNKDEEEHGDGCTSAERNKFDLISKRLLSDDFNGIGLTPTDDEEEDVQEQEVKKDVTQDTSLLPPPVVGSNTAEPQWTLRYRGEWEPLHPTNAEDEQNVTEKEQVIILTKPIRNNAKIVKSILTGSASNNAEAECSSALKVTKRVSFQEDVAQDEEEEVTSVSSVTKKSRKGLWLKLSLANLCEMKSRE